jgi:predicted amidohydrolase
MRVAVTQFATSLNTESNLATCIRIINQAASCQPNIIVLPAYCNNYIVEETANNLFMQALSEQAKQNTCYIAAHLKLSLSEPLGTPCLFTPEGEFITQTLNGLDTPFTRLGLLANNDILSFEKARHLALNKAQLLCYSHSSFSYDQGNLHAPTRACENKVFMAISNKVGSIEEQPLTEGNSITKELLVGSGHSKIISPSGNILVELAHNEEGFVFADIRFTDIDFPESSDSDISTATNQCRPDGSNVLLQARPELYKALPNAIENANVPQTANVALFTTYKASEQAIEDVCFYIENNLSDIIQLPELFFVADKSIANNTEQRAEVEAISQQVISRVSAELRPFQYVCTSLIIDGNHQGVIINEHGIYATQQQLHFCERYNWTTLGEELNIIQLPLEQGELCLAILTADDANIPEIVKTAALNKVHTLLVPFDIQEACEVEHNLISRAAEHNICIVAATREKTFSVSESNGKTQNTEKVKSKKATGFVINLQSKAVALNLVNSRKHSGYTNRTIVKYQHGKITKSLIHPLISCEK